MRLHRAEGTRSDFIDHLAFVVVAIGPVLAFSALSLPGAVKLFMVLPIAVMGAAYLRKPIRTFPFWEWALISLLCLSILWSDDPNYSTERVRTYVPVLVAVIVACSHLRPERIIKALQVGLAIIFASSIYILLTQPDKHQRRGDFQLFAQFPKNTFGGLLGVALILTLAKPRKSNYVLVPVLIAAIAFNYSVTTWIAVTVVGVGSLGARWAARNLRPTSVAPTMVIAVLLAIGAFGLAAFAGSSSALEAVGKDSSLGERTKIWSASWQEIKAAPLLGHGAWTFLDSASRSPVTLHIWAQFHGYQPPHPHNGFLDLMGQLGIVGVAVFLAMIVRGLSSGARLTLRGDPTARAGVTCVVFLLMFGSTEPAWIGDWLTFTVPCMIACTRAWTLRNDPGSPYADDTRGRGRLSRPVPPDPGVAGPREPALSGAGPKPPFLAGDQGS